jgi:hypothetical protein
MNRWGFREEDVLVQQFHLSLNTFSSQRSGGKVVGGQQKCQKPWGGELKWKNYWVGGKAGTGKSSWAASVVPDEEQSRKNLISSAITGRGRRGRLKESPLGKLEIQKRFIPFFWLVYLPEADSCKIVIEVSNWSRWGVRFPKVKWIKQSKNHVKFSKSSSQKPQRAESIPRSIQCLIFSSIVLLRFPNIYLIYPWFYAACHFHFHFAGHERLCELIWSREQIVR